MSEVDLRIQAAASFAFIAHERVGQVREYTGEPYINHPAEVASIVESVPHTPEMVMAAWLHDVVDDTGVPLSEIRLVFGDEVADMVSGLSSVSVLADGNRALRKEMELKHIAVASPQTKTIRLADIISNVKNIAERDPSFAVVYLHEKARLLEVLNDGDALLWESAYILVHEGLASLPKNP